MGGSPRRTRRNIAHSAGAFSPGLPPSEWLGILVADSSDAAADRRYHAANDRRRVESWQDRCRRPSTRRSLSCLVRAAVKKNVPGTLAAASPLPDSRGVRYRLCRCTAVAGPPENNANARQSRLLRCEYYVSELWASGQVLE